MILRGYGKGIYKANSKIAMLSALEGNIIDIDATRDLSHSGLTMTKHKSLLNLTDKIQSDILIGNLMINKNEDNPSWPSFLIDLNLAN